jgi:Transposase domain (DUF772)
MLRMYLLQVWFNLSDEGVEDAIYDSCAMRKFMRLDFALEQVPDATTLLHFRHLLEAHKPGEKTLSAGSTPSRPEWPVDQRIPRRLVDGVVLDGLVDVHGDGAAAFLGQLA